jgi:hypothetical protein
MGFKKTGDATQNTAVFCSCGNKLKKNAKKCSKCGKEVKK